jgi:ribonuclease P protein component
LDQTPFKLVTLRRRAEFLRIRGGGRSATPRFVLEGKRRAAGDTPLGPRFGFTVTKQMGNAVVRNRIKRRLRAALCEAGAKASDDFDYVIIARVDALSCDYQLLVEDFVAGFDRVHRTADNPKPREKSGKARR